MPATLCCRGATFHPSRPSILRAAPFFSFVRNAHLPVANDGGMPRAAAPIRAVHDGRGASSRGRDFQPSGKYFRGSGDGSGLHINKSINKALLVCKDLHDLGVTFMEHESELDPINIATAWMQLGKLYQVRKVPQASFDSLGRHMMRKTLALAHHMQLRVLSSTLWGMGKAKYDLEADPLGPYFAEVVEQVLSDLVSREDDWLGEVNSSMTWYALGQLPYPWNKQLLKAIVERTLEGVDSWETPQTVAQILSGMAFARINLTPSQKDKLAQATVRIYLTAERGQELYRSVDFMIKGANVLGLEIPVDIIREMHDITLEMPLPYALELGRKHYAGALYEMVEQGLQPTSYQAQLWCDRLMGDFGTKWDCEDLAWTMLALSSIEDYTPPAEVLRQLRAQLVALRNFNERQANRIRSATRTWNLRLTPQELAALQPSGKRS